MDAKGEKVSANKPFNFRWGPELAAKIATLQAEIAARGGEITPTTIIREGLLGCWPQVHQHLLVRHTTPPGRAADIARLVGIATLAIQHGVTPEQLEQHLATLIERQLPAA